MSNYTNAKQLDSSNDWFKKWRLCINETKTITIFFNKLKIFNLPQINISNHNIPWSKYSKYLGIIYDKNLSFNKQIKEIIRKATQIRSMLNLVIGTIPTKTKIQLYYMYVAESSTSNSHLLGYLGLSCEILCETSLATPQRWHIRSKPDSRRYKCQGSS